MLLALFAVPVLLATEIVPPKSEAQFKQPQIAASGANVGLVFGTDHAIYYAGSADQGRSFGAPVLVASVPTLSIGNHRGPRLALADGAIVVTAGIGPPAVQYGPNTLRSWRSTDSGKTWAAGPPISNPEGAGMGFHALASDGKRRLWSAWLGKEGDILKLLGAVSEDAGATWSKPRVIYESPDGNVCECCHPSVTIAANGTVFVMFRNALAGSRDLYLASSQDGGRNFQTAKLGQGTWPLQACPMDGGGLAEFENHVVSLWRRGPDLFLARPDGKPEERIAEGKNAAVALRPAGVFLVWSSAQGVMAKVPGSTEPRVLSKTGSFPSITSQGPLVIAAWEESGKIRTERLDYTASQIRSHTP